MIGILAQTGLVVLGLSLAGTLLYFTVLLGERLFSARLSRRAAYYLWVLVLLRFAVPLAPEVSLLGGAESWIAQGNLTALLQGASGAGAAVPAAGEANGAVGAAAAAGETPFGAADDTAAGQPAGVQGGDADRPGADAAAPTPAEAAAVQKPISDALAFLGAVWLVGAVAAACRKGRQYRMFLRDLEMTSTPVAAEEVKRLYAALRRDMGIYTGPALYTSKGGDAPMLVGILRPRLYLPAALAAASTAGPSPLGEGGVGPILRHELTHYRRRDILYKWAVQTVCVLHWFNPAVYALRERTDRDCELSCDEAVCRALTQEQRREYGNTLLSVLTVLAAPQSAGARSERAQDGFCTTMGAEGEKLKERLGNIKHYRGRTKMDRVISILLAAALIAGSVFIGACGISDGERAGTALTPQEAALAKWAASLEITRNADGTGTLSFVVPEAVEGWVYKGHFAGRVFTDAERTMGMSHHVFEDKEASGFTPGHGYGAPIPLEQADEYYFWMALAPEQGEAGAAAEAGEYGVELRLSGFLLPGTALEPAVFADWQGAYWAVIDGLARRSGETVEYVLRDIDGNGIPELLAGNPAGRGRSYVYTFAAQEDSWGTLQYLGDVENAVYGSGEGDGVSAGIYTYGGFGTGVGGSLFYRMTASAMVRQEGPFSAEYVTPPEGEVLYRINGEEAAAEQYENLISGRFNDKAAPRIRRLAAEQADRTGLAVDLASWQDTSGGSALLLSLADRFAAALMLRDDKARWEQLAGGISREALQISVSSPWVVSWSLRPLSPNSVEILYNQRTSALGDFYVTSETVTFEEPLTTGSKVIEYSWETMGDLTAVRYATVGEAVSAVLIKRAERDYYGGETQAEGHVVLETEDHDTWVQVYLLAMMGNYGFENGVFTKVSGSGVLPCFINLRKAGAGQYTFIEMWQPLDGAEYYSSIEEAFPASLLPAVEKAASYHAVLEEQEKAYAEAYLTEIGREAAVDNDRQALDYPLARLPVSVSNALIGDKTYPESRDYPYWLGTREAVADGVRFVYEKRFEPLGEPDAEGVYQNGKIIYSKTRQEGNRWEEVERLLFFVQGGQLSGPFAAEEYEQFQRQLSSAGPGKEK